MMVTANLKITEQINVIQILSGEVILRNLSVQQDVK